MVGQFCLAGGPAPLSRPIAPPRAWKQRSSKAFIIWTVSFSIFTVSECLSGGGILLMLSIMTRTYFSMAWSEGPSVQPLQSLCRTNRNPGCTGHPIRVAGQDSRVSRWRYIAAPGRLLQEDVLNVEDSATVDIDLACNLWMGFTRFFWYALMLFDGHACPAYRR